MELATKLKLLPGNPGVYLMKDQSGQIIYVGKAISLKNRVRSYFQAARNLTPKTRMLVKQIHDLEYIITDNEIEALILECNLIKEHRPRFNISLKDDKHYPYLKLTVDEQFPRLVITRKINKDGGRYFGPYVEVGALNETLRLLKSLFPLRTCKREKLDQRSRPCLNAHIKRCLAPCAGQVSPEAYADLVRSVILFLDGRQEDLAKQLQREMAAAASTLDFERAARLRDRLQAIEKVVARQKVISAGLEDRDVLAQAMVNGETAAQVLNIRAGKIIGARSFTLEGAEDWPEGEVLAALVKQYYAVADTVPPQILLPGAVEERELIVAWLTAKRGGKVDLKAPQRGKLKELVEMAARNARMAAEQRQAEKAARVEQVAGALAELQQALHLPDTPYRIECYDISNIQGREAVGSMVVMENGRLRPRDYRRFKIKTVEGPNDFAAMAEVLGRRFSRMKPVDEEERTGADDDAGQAGGGSSFGRRPDLVIVDGGKGQLSAALEVMADKGVYDLPVFGLAKEFEHLFAPGRPDPIILPPNSAGLKLLQRLRDEAHRFAIEYHRRLHREVGLKSVLEEIPGIGKARRQALYEAFPDLEAIRRATVEELAAVPGMNRRIAADLHHHLQESSK